MKTTIFISRLVQVMFLSLLTTALYSQVKVFDNGNVGVRYTTSTPLSKFVFNTQGHAAYDVYFYSGSRLGSGGAVFCQTATGTGTASHIYGLIGQANLGTNNYQYGTRGAATNTTALTSGRAYGIYGIAGNAANGFNYGVYGYLYGSNNGAAVFGTSSGDYQIPGKYAGYFYGNVHITGTLNGYPITTSDEKTKTNIKSLETIDASVKLGSLKPIKFNLKQREVVSSDSLKVMNYYDPDSELFKKTKYGFIAQELKEVFPDLVYIGEDGLLAIDYVGLIPIVIQTIQEQQKRIEFLEKAILEIKASIAAPVIKEE